MYPPISPATSASNPEKTIAHSLKYSALHSCTTSSFTFCGIGATCFQFTAFGYGLPADRGDAPRAWITNHGWADNKVMNLCPTVPVAPKIPTLIFPPGCMAVKVGRQIRQSQVVWGTVTPMIHVTPAKFVISKNPGVAQKYFVYFEFYTCIPHTDKILATFFMWIGWELVKLCSLNPGHRSIPNVVCDCGSRFVTYVMWRDISVPRHYPRLPTPRKLRRYFERRWLDKCLISRSSIKR